MSSAPFLRVTCQLPAAKIALLRFLTEGYDGLLFVRTLDPRHALVEIAYPPTRVRDAEELIAALAEECGLSAADLP